MTQHLLSEADILKGCCDGDRRMQEALFNRHSSRMKGICRRYTHSSMDAEDQLHEGFMIIFKQIRTFRGGSLEAWMRRIMINQCLEAFRKSKRERMWFQEITDETAANIGSGTNNWYDFLEAGQIMQMIDKLPIGAKTVFSLSAIEGYTHAEIATMLGIAESASRSQLTRAKQALQKAYEQISKTERK